MSGLWGKGSSSASGPASGSTRRETVRQVNESLYEFHKPACTPSMQVVFFHGLHLENSVDAQFDPWQSEDGTFWPQRWLPEDFPDAHIFAATYSEGVGQSSSRSSYESFDLYLIAENLLQDMMDKEIGLHCPVVLVGYGFGGIVIKQLCLQASKQERILRYRKTFLNHIRGIFYYGTPHHGFPFAFEQADFLRPFLTEMRIRSTEAARLKDEFDRLRGVHENWRIHGIGESRPTTSNLFPNVVVVPEASARDGEWFNIIMDADHSSISKPVSKIDRRFSALTNLLYDVARTSQEDARVEKETRPESFQHLPEHMTHMHDAEEEVVSKLETVTALGLVGMGGLGKTTLAKAVFNILLPKFDYSCFVPDVKLIRGREDHVKEELWKCLHFQGRKVGGKPDFYVLRGKTLLLALDDVSDSDRDILTHVLLDLSKDTDPASRFIWTSRESGLLAMESAVHEVPFLAESHSRILFMKHAFPEARIPGLELGSLVESVVEKCDGLPLALEVLGKSLRGKEKQEVWEATLSALETAEKVKNLNQRLWAKLRPSFEMLGKNEQEMFLDATNFFCGNLNWTLRVAKMAWRAAYGLISDLFWQTLVDRSLVYDVGDDENIKVHEQLVSVGRMIASEPEHNGEYQVRKCNADGELELLGTSDAFQGKEVRALRVVVSDFYHEPRRVDRSNTAFHNLTKLRFLEIEPGIQFGGEMNGTSLPTQIVLLKYAGEVLFNPALQKDLAVLKLSEMQYVPSSLGKLSKLNYLEIESYGWEWDLSYSLGKLSSLTFLRIKCPGLRSLPESLGDLRALRHLIFDGGDSWKLAFEHLQALQNLTLSSFLPESFGGLSSLTYLTFRNCRRLNSLPRSFGQLRALTHLEFDSCRNLQSLPDSFGSLSSLSHLEFRNCHSLNSLPESFGSLSASTHLEFHYCTNLQSLPDSFGSLSSLSHLEFRNCHSLNSLPESFGSLSALTHLEFDSCRNLQSLPDSFGSLSSLSHLEFRNCHSLNSLPESFGSLSASTHLEFHYCTNLQSSPDSFGSLSSLSHLEFRNCHSLNSLPESFGSLSALTHLEFDSCRNLQSLPDSFGSLSSLSHLEFRTCHSLNSLPESFGSLSALTHLEFHYCTDLQSLPDSFGSLSSLSHLEFRNCDSLNSLPDSFGNLSALTHLEFDSCEKLQSLPDSFGSLSSLSHLAFRNCDSLNSLPDSFGNLSALTHLEFDSCEKLQSLPDSFGSLSSLSHLAFRNCDSLNSLPDSFGNLSALTHLEFDSCTNLQSLPDSFGSLSSLSHLEFRDCHSLNSLPDSFGNLSALTHLEFDYCENLQSLPDSFGNLSSLSHLAFRNCDSLNSLPDSFGNLSALTHLEFDSCEKLQSLPDSFGSLSSLSHLEFRDCHSLNSLPDSFGNLSALTHLEFHYCTDLQSLPGSFGSLSSLSHLEFRNCHSLNSLPESFGSLSALTHLEFDDCEDLQSLPDSFGHLSSLSHLEFTGCDSLNSLPESFGFLSALTHLEFHYCTDLQSLPDSFGNLSSLSHLEFRNCENLRSFPKSFEYLSALSHLKFEPDSFGHFSALRHLRSERENLQFLPESLEKLKALKSLPLSTSIRTAEETGSKVRGLNLREEEDDTHEQDIDTPQLETKRLNSEEFHKSGTALQSLKFFDHPVPLIIEGAQGLKDFSATACLGTRQHLIISNCPDLTKLRDNISHLVHLRSLQIEGCEGLTEIPEFFGEVKALEQLNIWNCPDLVGIPETIGRLPSLQYLRIKNCKNLSNLPGLLGELRGLEQLIIWSCPSLVALPDTIGNLRALQHLRIQQCESLKDIPESLGNLQSGTTDYMELS